MLTSVTEQEKAYSLLYSALYEHQNNYVAPPPPLLRKSQNSEDLDLSSKINAWLNRIGLKVNPFDALDAGEDPLIPFYLIDHDQFQSVSRDQTSFVFAPPGSGKTAYRVRLARDCRVGKNNRKIFPIVYKLPSPIISDLNGREHLRNLCAYAAQELMLYLAYHSSLLSKITDELLATICHTLEWNLPIRLEICLQQLTDAKNKNLTSLLKSFDLTAGLLPNPPGPKDLLSLSERLTTYSETVPSKPSPEERFKKLTDLILNELGFESIYILVDGVDGYIETARNPSIALEAISWLLENATVWGEKKRYMKFFLPNELLPEIKKRYSMLLTSDENVTIIQWDVDALSEVIQQRLQEASGGKFNSLRAIGNIPLRGARFSPEEQLAQLIVELGNPNPRDLIKAVRKLFEHHITNTGDQEKLTPQDLKAACAWIREERQSIKMRHA